jgi:putative two-component system response regulator
MRRADFPDLSGSRILIVDDQPANITLLEFVLDGAGYRQISSATDPRKGLALCSEMEPDLLLLDLHMPHLDGFQFLSQLGASVAPGAFLPVLVLTADVSVETKRKALAMGADDFLSKPLDTVEVSLRVRNLLEQRWLYGESQRNNALLESKVEQRTRELAVAQIEALKRLALSAEYRDDETGQHTARVGDISALIAAALGQDEQQVRLIGMAAPLHDIGKIGVPDHVLLKPGALTVAERAIMQSHTTIGAEILGKSSSPLLRMAREIALCHHERWDGLGYPGGLKGGLIPLTARIVAVADTFDALVHERPYKKAWTTAEALREMRVQRGRQFDPAALDAFLTLTQGDSLRNLAESVKEEHVTDAAVETVVTMLRANP